MENCRCKISVIIPVFNTEKHLRRCVDSVLSQTFRDFELILVDDCSTDGSPAICDKYARKDGRVKAIHNAQNRGCPQSRKVGMDVALGDYVLFADSDDWVESDMLELMYNKAVDYDLDIVYCDIYRNTDTEQQECDASFSDDKIEMIKQIITWQYGFSTAVWNKLIKREIYRKIDFPQANFGEDRQIIVQAIHYANKIGYAKSLLYHYYMNANSLSYNNDKVRILQRYIDMAEIMIWTINFIRNNFTVDFSIFEPELSNSVNSLKLCFVQEKQIRNASVFHELYPASNRRIFNPAWRDTFANKVTLFLSVHDKTFILADIFNAIFNVVMAIYQAVFHSIRSVYRIIVPKNLRDVIWHKRNKTADK